MITVAQGQIIIGMIAIVMFGWGVRQVWNIICGR